ncbi:MAG: hypothetical protein AB7I13_00395 [Vicinamibacterales bacterium]
MNAFLEPTVIAAAIAAVVALLAPRIAARAQRRNQALIDATAVEVREIDAREQLNADLQTEIARRTDVERELRESLEECGRARRAWELRDLAYQGVLQSIELQAVEVLSGLRVLEQSGTNGVVGSLARLATQLLGTVQEGRRVGRGG